MIKDSINLPNLISLFRLATVPFILWFIGTEKYLLSLWFFIFSALSDALDGFIAKTFKMETQIGRYLDPLADKLLITSVFISFGFIGVVPLWLVLIICIRDIGIIAGSAWIYTKKGLQNIEPTAVSKLNTVMQLLFAVIVLAQLGYMFSLPGLSMAFSVYISILTLLSGYFYLKNFLKEYKSYLVSSANKVS